jgi:hypothetical protein
MVNSPERAPYLAKDCVIWAATFEKPIRALELRVERQALKVLSPQVIRQNSDRTH